MKLSILLCFLFCAFTAQARPAQIILLRHAEKPTGKSDELSDIGFKRAAALPQVFKTRSDLQKFGMPFALFAAGYLPGDTSKRAVETMKPSAAALRLTLDTQFHKGQEREIADFILNSRNLDGKTVVICWTHSVLPDLAHALGAMDAPDQWQGTTFDRFWVLTDNGREYGFADLPQRALPGDSIQ